MLDLKGLLSKARLPMDITRRGFLEVSTVAAAVAAMNMELRGLKLHRYWS